MVTWSMLVVVGQLSLSLSINAGGGSRVVVVAWSMLVEVSWSLSLSSVDTGGGSGVAVVT